MGVALVLAASLLVRPGVGISSNNAAACTYGYLGAPTITGISPTSGSTLGGSNVTVTGCGFTGATSVKFGATTASFTVNTDSDITAASPAHVAGAVDITVTTPSGPSAHTAADMFTYATVCNAVTETAAPPSPQATATPIVFTAVATGCPSAGPLYEFWMRAASQSSWQLIQAFSTLNTYNWNSTGAAPGIVNFGVWAKDAASTNQFDALFNLPFSVTAATCASVTEAALPTSPQPSGTPVVFTATAHTCSHTGPMFEFWMRAASQSSWQLIQPFSTLDTYSWNSRGAAAGVVNFGVWIKDAASTNQFDAFVNLPFSVTASTCTSVTDAAVPNPVTPPTHSIVTATPAGCTHSGPLFEFWMKVGASGTWTVIQGFSTTATYDWNTTGAAAGTVFIGVWVKDVDSINTVDAFNSTSITVT